MRGKGGPNHNTEKSAPMRSETIRQRFQFHPEIANEEGTVSIWLKDLGIYGTGATLAEAKADLVEEVREYALQYDSDPTLQKAPNRQGHALMIRLAQAADKKGKLSNILFANLQEI